MHFRPRSPEELAAVGIFCLSQVSNMMINTSVSSACNDDKSTGGAATVAAGCCGPLSLSFPGVWCRGPHLKKYNHHFLVLLAPLQQNPWK